MSAAIPPVTQSITVTVPPVDAHGIWRDRLGHWWPLARLSVFGDGTTVAFEGDEIVERGPDGRTALWGRVTAEVPGELLSFTWHPGHDADRATSVTVTFEPARVAGRSGVVDGTHVHLEHSGWHTLADPAATRDEYNHGWPRVLDAYASDDPDERVWLVLRHSAGPAAPDGPLFAHPDFAEHLSFLKTLRTDGVLVSAGPLSRLDAPPTADGMAVLLVPRSQVEDYVARARRDDQSVVRGLLAVDPAVWNVALAG